jgi:hypothetical protein
MTFPARLYTKLRKYRLKDATDALQGLAQMAGDPQYDNSTRENNLNWLYISLQAAHHLSYHQIQLVLEEARKARDAE